MVEAAAPTDKRSRSCRGSRRRSPCRWRRPCALQPAARSTGVDHQEGRRRFARLNQVEGGRERAACVARADDARHGPGEGRRQKASSAPDEPDRRDGHRAQPDKILERRENVRQARSPQGQHPGRCKDEKLPWRGPRKWKQDGQPMSEPWPKAMDRFWDREKPRALWLETRCWSSPTCSRPSERYMQLLNEGHAGLPGGPHRRRARCRSLRRAKATFTTRAVPTTRAWAARRGVRSWADEPPLPILSPDVPIEPSRRAAQRAGWEKVWTTDATATARIVLAWEGQWEDLRVYTSTTTLIERAYLIVRGRTPSATLSQDVHGDAAEPRPSTPRCRERAGRARASEEQERRDSS